MNTENSKTSESHRFKLDLTDKINLKNLNKNMALANLSIYCTWITQFITQFKSIQIKLKIELFSK